MHGMPAYPKSAPMVSAVIGKSVNNHLQSIAPGYELKLYPVVSSSMMGLINEGT